MAKKKDAHILIGIVLALILIVSILSYTGVIQVGTGAVTGTSGCTSKPFMSLDGVHYQNFDQLRATEKITFTDKQFTDGGFSLKADGVYVCQ